MSNLSPKTGIETNFNESQMSIGGSICVIEQEFEEVSLKALSNRSVAHCSSCDNAIFRRQLDKRASSNRPCVTGRTTTERIPFTTSSDARTFTLNCDSSKLCGYMRCVVEGSIADIFNEIDFMVTVHWLNWHIMPDKRTFASSNITS